MDLIDMFLSYTRLESMLYYQNVYLNIHQSKLYHTNESSSIITD